MQETIKTELITDYMKANRLTVHEFCKQCGISESTYYRIMHGEDFYLTSLFQIVKKMNIKICDIFI